jgi:hypothetical protein
MNREVILGDFRPHDIFLRSRWIMIALRQSIYFSDGSGLDEIGNLDGFERVHRHSHACAASDPGANPKPNLPEPTRTAPQIAVHTGAVQVRTQVQRVRTELR